MTNRRDLNYYRSLNYRVELFFDSEEKFWYAEFPELPGCLAHGATKEEALANSVEAKEAWLAATFDSGRDIPEPRPEIEYSGRFLLRVPKSLHKKLASEAEREGTSINRLAIQILSEELERRQTMRTVDNSIRVAVKDAFGQSSNVPYTLRWLAAARPRELEEQALALQPMFEVFAAPLSMGQQRYIGRTYGLVEHIPTLASSRQIIGVLRPNEEEAA